jgi:hypothetical protein
MLTANRAGGPVRRHVGEMLDICASSGPRTLSAFKALAALGLRVLSVVVQPGELDPRWFPGASEGVAPLSSSLTRCWAFPLPVSLTTRPGHEGVKVVLAASRLLGPPPEVSVWHERPRAGVVEAIPKDFALRHYFRIWVILVQTFLCVCQSVIDVGPMSRCPGERVPSGVVGA